MLTYMALYSPTGADTTWTSDRALRLVTVGRARSRATSTWPLAKARERELSSGTNWKAMLAGLAFVPQYASLRVTLTRDWRTYSTKRKGPVPATLGPGWVPCFKMLYSGWTTSSMTRRFGDVGVTSTVMASTTTVESAPSPTKPPPPEAIRSNVYLTSAAPNGLPSWNLTPGRRWKRKVLGPTCSQRRASPGLML